MDSTGLAKDDSSLQNDSAYQVEAIRDEIAMQLVRESAEAGHESWLASQNIRILAPTSLGEYNERPTRSGMVRYSTMEFLQSVINDDGQTVSITPREFLERHMQDLQGDQRFAKFLEYHNMAYVIELVQACEKGIEGSMEQFNSWMVEIATKRIHDNDAYGRAAKYFLNLSGFDLEALDLPMTDELAQTLSSTEQALESLWSLNTVGELENYLIANPNLKNMMLASHISWRSDKLVRIQEKYNVDAQNLTEERYLEFVGRGEKGMMELEKALKNEDMTKVRALIEEIRDSMLIINRSPHMTFDIIFELAGMIEEASKKYEDPKAALEISKGLIDQVRYDANPCIIQGIRNVNAKRSQKAT